jgi:L-arabinonolactonase
VPDGSCVAAQGHVWNAVWEGYRVERWSPEGRITTAIDVPVKKPTCCAFGGRNLETLFITSSQLGEQPADLAREPLAGHLFAVEPGVAGIADADFAG